MKYGLLTIKSCFLPANLDFIQTGFPFKPEDASPDSTIVIDYVKIANGLAGDWLEKKDASSGFIGCGIHTEMMGHMAVGR